MAAPSPIDAGDVRRAGLELVRHVVVVGLLEGHRRDHVAAALVGRHGFEQGEPAVEHADAGRAVQLVPGEGVEVAAERLHVDRQVRHGLGAVDQHRPPRRVGARSTRSADRVDRAERVATRAITPTICVRGPSSRSNSVQVDLARVGDGHHLQAWRRSARRPSATGTMFEWCSMPVIRISSPGRARLRPKLCATRLIASVRAAREDDLARGRRR